MVWIILIFAILLGIGSAIDKAANTRFVKMNTIPIPHISEFLYEDFMLPLCLDARTVANRADIPLADMRGILADQTEITPEISAKLGAVFGISPMLFYNIQRDINNRKKTTVFSKVAEYA